MQAPRQTEITLRNRIEDLRASGRPLDLAQAMDVVIPLAVELAQQHHQGYQFFLYPSALFEGEDGRYHASARSAQPPTDPRDVACLPPESQGMTPGDARASVYGVAAILYELTTLQTVGLGMLRPSSLNPQVTEQLEMILTKALVSEPEHRPDDLNALAQAFYQVKHSPKTVPPPPADISHLDHDESFDVDVSMSMLPPLSASDPAPRVIPGVPRHAPLPPGMGRPQAAAPAMPAAPLSDTEAMKATMDRMQADARPRFVVVRHGMDHGPFTAVELLQQIASHTFEEDDVVRDSIEKSAFTIAESPEFAPFARHARLGRHEQAEKVALEHAVVQESRSTMGKTILGLSLLGVLLLSVGIWFMTSRGSKRDEIAIVEETAANVESDHGLKASKKAKAGGGAIRGSRGGFPQLAGGTSCEAAQAAYVQEMKMGEKGQADLTVGQLGAVLNTGSYLNACGIPSSMSVNVCAAIQNGRAVGVTVTTKPPSPKAACVANQIRKLRFPSNPKLDVTRTSFAAQ